ncbi:M23 family metallopeptidase [soil metagenome]
MRRGRRWLTGAASLLVLGSCAGSPQRPQPVAPRVAQPPPVKRVTQPPVRATFSYEGAMIQGGVILGVAPSGTSMLSLDGGPVPIAKDGRFLIGFDRDAKPTATLIATLESGGTVSDVLTISPRGWQIERLNTLPKFPQETAEFNRLRPPELAQINAARRIQSDSLGWREQFMWPAVGRISGLFGSQRIYKGEPGSYHSGVDIAQPTGTPVLAPADGVVILAADHPFTLEGNLLMIDHGMGLNSAFLHLSRIDVHVGERVQRGEQIGAVGMTGRATGPHLHWAMKWRDSRLDPMLVAGPMPVVR